MERCFLLVINTLFKHNFTLSDFSWISYVGLYTHAFIISRVCCGTTLPLLKLSNQRLVFIYKMTNEIVRYIYGARFEMRIIS